MGQRSVRGKSKYQVLHELCEIAGWRYEGPIRYDNEQKPQGFGYRSPSGERSLITLSGKVYLEDRTKENVWHELRWVSRKTMAELTKELMTLKKEQRQGSQ